MNVNLTIGDLSELWGRQFHNEEQVVVAFREWMQMPEPEFLSRRNIYNYVKIRQLHQNIRGLC